MYLLNFKKYLNRRMLCIFLLGFSSGLPLALVGGSLQAWFATSNVDIKTIGFLSLIGIPYSYKFVWAPILDKYIPPFFGRRRGWLLITQACLVVSIILMSCFAPTTSPKLLVFIALLLAFFSASQDIAYDAYRAEVLPYDERGLGAALGVEGYRVAMLISGAFALILADNIGWHATYLVMSLFMLIGIAATFYAPNVEKDEVSNNNVLATFKEAFFEILTRKNALLLLCLVLIYKLGDVFSHALTTTFLLRFLQFTLTEVGFINKTLGLVATLIGIFFGGLLMTRIGLFRSLFVFGVLQAVTNLLYAWLAVIGKNYTFACSAIFIENLCAGMGTAAFVALLMSLCNRKFTATQYALLSSLSAVGRIYLGPLCSTLVEMYGWSIFYSISFVVALPGLVLLVFLRNNIKANNVSREVATA